MIKAPSLKYPHFIESGTKCLSDLFLSYAYLYLIIGRHIKYCYKQKVLKDFCVLIFSQVGRQSIITTELSHNSSMFKSMIMLEAI